MQIDPSSRFLVTGGTGLVGHALLAALAAEGFTNVVGVGSRDYDLREGREAERLFADVRPDFVFHLAARVHGLGGNTKYKSDILYENVMMNTHVVEQARRAGVKKIVAMGSGCVYPELKEQEELFENQIWIGPPHPSEDSYAHAKRLMLAHLMAAKHQYGLVSAFAISGNLYGPHDKFNFEDGHVTPSLIAKFYDAAQKGTSVKVWGSGVAVRDFSYADDAANGLMHLLKHLEGPVNLGSGFLHPIKDIVSALEEATAHKVKVEWDPTKSDGQLKRFYNLDILTKSGFKAKTDLREGVIKTYQWYVKNAANARA